MPVEILAARSDRELAHAGHLVRQQRAVHPLHHHVHAVFILARKDFDDAGVVQLAPDLGLAAESFEEDRIAFGGHCGALIATGWLVRRSVPLNTDAMGPSATTPSMR